MGAVRKAITNTLKGAVTAYLRFPAAMLSATALALMTSIRIANNTILATVQFDRWQMALAVTALISLAWTAGMQSGLDKSSSGTLSLKTGLLSLTGLLALIPLVMLIQPLDGRIPQLTITRVIAIGGIAILALVLAISYKQSQTDFNKRFFMLHKAFFIALLYMLVVMGGSNFIAFAVETLLLNTMSSDVYQHLTTWSGFFGFAFFLGNLPDLRRSADPERVQVSQKQPRFIEVLLVFVMVPIMLVLSLVLLIWALRMLVTGQWPMFAQLASIFTGFILVGIWLNIMIADNEHGLAKFFRRIYPILALIFLAVEAVAIVRQVRLVGIRGGEYAAAALWLFGLTAAVFFLIRPIRLNHLTAWTAALVIILSILPATGYDDITFRSQLTRLEQVLTDNDMLSGGQVTAATQDNLPSKDDQILITEATSYLLSIDDRGRLPGWFPGNNYDYDRFLSTYGFQQRWNLDDYDMPGPGRGAWVGRESGTVDLTGYDLSIVSMMDKDRISQEFTTDRGSYQFEWQANYEYSGDNTVPLVTLRRDSQVLIEQDLTEYITTISEQVRKMERFEYENRLPAEQMQLELETDEVRLLLVFEAIEMNWDENDQVRAYMIVRGIYFGEK